MNYSKKQLTAWMFRQTRPVLAPLLASSVARVLDQMLGVFMLSFAAWQVGRLATEPGEVSWVFTILVLLGVAFVKAFLRYGEQFSGHYVAFKALELLRRHAFVNLIPQAPAISRSSRSADLLVRLTRDIDRIEVFFAHTFAPAVSSVLVPLLSALCFWWIGASWLAVVTLGFNVVTLALLLLAGMRQGEASSADTLAVRSRVASDISDIVGGNREIRGYGLETSLLSRLSEDDAHVSAQSRGTHALLGFRRGLSFGMMLAMVSVVVLMGASQIAAGTLTLPVVLAVAAGSMRGWESVRGVEDFSVFLLASFASADRLRTLTEGEPHPVGGTSSLPDGPLSLSAQNVTFCYRDSLGNAHQALTEVSLEVPAGSWHALVGRTGCGKSTLANLFVRVDDPDAGKLTVGGQDLRQTNPQMLREGVVYVPQRAHLFNDTVAANLRLACPGATEEQLWDALRVAEVDADVRSWNAGLDTRLGAKGEAVSGGQRQRLALARAVLMRPRALILDEATAHLDPERARSVRANLRRALPEATVLEITHRLDQLDGVDCVHRMDAGALIN